MTGDSIQARVLDRFERGTCLYIYIELDCTGDI